MSIEDYRAEEPPVSPDDIPSYLSRELRRVEAITRAVSSRHEVRFVDTTSVLSAAEIVVVDATSGDVFLDLPGATSAFGVRYTVIKSNAANNAILRSAETINGEGSATLSAQYQIGELRCDGKEWFMAPSAIGLQNRIATVSAQLSTTSANLDTKIETLSAVLSTTSASLCNQIKVLSASLSATSAALDTKIEVLSAALSTTSANLDTKIDAVSAQLSTTSANLDTKIEVLSSALSTTSSGLQTQIDNISEGALALIEAWTPTATTHYDFTWDESLYCGIEMRFENISTANDGSYLQFYLGHSNGGTMLTNNADYHRIYEAVRTTTVTSLTYDSSNGNRLCKDNIGSGSNEGISGVFNLWGISAGSHGYPGFKAHSTHMNNAGAWCAYKGTGYCHHSDVLTNSIDTLRIDWNSSDQFDGGVGVVYVYGIKKS